MDGWMAGWGMPLGIRRGRLLNIQKIAGSVIGTQNVASKQRTALGIPLSLALTHQWKLLLFPELQEGNVRTQGEDEEVIQLVWKFAIGWTHSAH